MDESERAIYVPPKNGLPFLVVTFTKEGVQTQTAATRSEARVMLTRERSRRSKVEARLANLIEGKPSR
jgi:hypothetical protein